MQARRHRRDRRRAASIAGEALAFFGKLLEVGRRRPAVAELVVPSGNLVIDRFDPDLVGPKHDAAPVPWEAKTVQPHDVGIGCFICDPFVKNFADLVDRTEQDTP